MFNLNKVNFANKKRLKNFLLVFVLALLFTMTAKLTFSEGNPKVNITYNGETWDGKDIFNNKWFSNSIEREEDGQIVKGEITFEVDLKEKYQQYVEKCMADGITPVASNISPFKINAKIGNDKESAVDIIDADIVVTEKVENESKAIYEVKVKLPNNNEEKVFININVEEDNSWEMGAFEKEFYIQRDLTSPQISLSGVKDGDIIKIDTDIIFTVSEKNFDTNNIKLVIKKNGTEIDSPNITSNDEVSQAAWVPTEDGFYEIIFSAIDKAGNTSKVMLEDGTEAEEIKVKFEVDKDGKPSVISIDGNGETLDSYVENNNVKYFKENVTLSILLDRKSDVEVFYKLKDSENETAMVLNTNTNKYEATITEPGIYEVYSRTTTTTKSTNKIINFVIDKTTPTLEINAGDVVIANGQKFSDNQQVLIKIKDDNLDITNSSIVVTKDGVVYKNGVNAEDDTVKIVEGLFEEGNYHVTIAAVDLAGNSLSDGITAELRFTIDTEAPILGITMDGNNLTNHQYYFKDNKKINVSVEDKTLSFDKTISNGDIEAKTIINGVETSLKTGDSNNPAVSNNAVFDLVANDNEESVYNISATAKDYFDRATSISEKKIVVDKKAPSITENEDLNSAYQSDKTLTVTVADTFLKNSSVTVTKFDYDNEILEQYNDSLAIDNGIATFTKEFSNGKYKVTIEAADLVGNETEKTYEFVIAKSGPIITIQGIDEGGHYQEASINVNVDWSKKGTNKLEVKRDNGSFEEQNVKWQKNNDKIGYKTDYSIKGNNKDGKYELKVSADGLANHGYTSVTKKFVIDTVAPVITIPTIDKYITTEKLVKDLKLSVKEKNYETNVVTITIRKDGNDNGSLNFNSTGEVSVIEEEVVRKAFKEDGYYEVYVDATDKAGNSSKNSVSFNVDNSFESVTIKNNGNNVSNYQVFNEDELASTEGIIISLNDKNIEKKDSSITINKNGIPYASFTVDNTDSTSMVVKKKFEEGNYEVIINALDKAENRKELIIKFAVDKKPPLVEVNTVDDNGNKGKIDDKQYYDEDKTVEISIEDTTLSYDQTKANLIIKGGNKNINTSLKTGSKNEPLMTNKHTEVFNKDGNYIIDVDTIDAVGNEVKVTKNIIIDKINPVITVEGGSLEGIYTDDKNVKIKVLDTNLKEATVRITENLVQGDVEVLEVKEVNGQGIAQFEKLFEEGNYTIEVYGKDYVDKQCHATYNFTVDKSPVDIKVEAFDKDSQNVALVNNKKYNNINKLKFTLFDTTLDLDNTTLELLIDGKAVDNIPSWSLSEDRRTATLEYDIETNGNYSLKITSKDKANSKDGNNSEPGQQVTLSFVIDTKAPEIEISGIENNAYHTTETIHDKLNIKVTERYFADNDVEIKVTSKIPDFQPINLNLVKTGEESILSKSEIQKTFKEEGVYTITVDAKDNAGNAAETKTITFTVDNTGATIRFEGIANNSINNANHNRELKIVVTETNYANNNVTVLVEREGDPSFILPNQWINEGNPSTNTAVESVLTNIFNLDGKYNITVNTIDKAGNKSTASHSFIIDQGSPKINILGLDGGTIDNEGFIYFKDKKNITIVVSDNNLKNQNNIDILPKLSIYKLENGNPTDVTAAIIKNNNWVVNKTPESYIEDKIALAFQLDNINEQGTYQLYVSYEDQAGNTTNNNRVKLIIDSTKPTITLSGIQEGSFNNVNKTLTINVNETNFKTNTVNVFATRNGESYDIGQVVNTAVNSSLSYTFTEDGVYQVTVTSEDKAGNVADSKVVNFTIDKTNPRITITGVVNNEHYNVDKTLNIAIADNNHNINTVNVTKSGQPYNVGGFIVDGTIATLTHTFSQEGEYVITISSTDKAGNKNSSNIKFTIDKTAPVITPKFKGQNRVIKNGEYINEAFTAEFALDKPEDIITSVTLNNGNNIKDAIPVSAMDGKYEYKVTARDKAGNETTISIMYNIDVTKPDVRLTGIISGFFNKNITPKYTITDNNLDNSRTSVTLNGTNFISGTTIEKEGEYTFKAIGTDLANNVTSRTILFTVDKTPPKIIFVEDISGKYLLETLIPQFIIEDLTDYTIVTQTLNGAPYKLGDPITEDGKYVLFLEIKDKAGNISNTTVEFILDQTKPKFIIEGAEHGKRYYDTVNLSIGLENPLDTIKEVLVNGEVAPADLVEENGGKVYKMKLSDKQQYTIKLLATDEAGNETEETLIFQIAEKTFLIKFYENKVLFYGTVIGLILLSIGLLFIILANRKLEDEQN